MKLSSFFSYFVISALIYGVSSLEGMPGIEEFEIPEIDASGIPSVYEEVTEEPEIVGAKALDKQISADLKSFKKQKTISGKINVLSNITKYSQNQSVNQQTQINFCNALSNLDNMSKSYKLSKVQINHILRLFKRAQTSTLIHSGFTKNISDMIQFWDRKSKTFGLSRYQQAIQRRKSVPRTTRGR